jgi:2-methylisocitrate lyase-like PEP mutase family enzyme
MQQQERARHLASLHVKGNPLIVYNAWDAGSAKAIAGAGARVIGTSSWAVAAAHGYEDGEAIPLGFVESIVKRIAQSSGLPVTVDVEGGYSDDPQLGAENVARFLDAGVAGINLEDRVVSGSGLHGIEAQSARIAAIRKMADARGISLFINARTDVFFGAGVALEQALEEAKRRASAYAAAGASGFFVPGLVDRDAIAKLAAAIDLPLNVMVMPGLPAASELRDVGVARISYGPGPYLQAMEALRKAATDVLKACPPADAA